MTPSFIGRYAMISPGVRPTISFASLPTASILLSRTETATTDGSLSTMPRPGTKTSTVVVPRSIPSFGENARIVTDFFEVVQVFRRYRLEKLPHPPHRYGIESIAQAGTVELVAEILHKLS